MFTADSPDLPPILDDVPAPVASTAHVVIAAAPQHTNVVPAVTGSRPAEPHYRRA